MKSSFRPASSSCVLVVLLLVFVANFGTVNGSPPQEKPHLPELSFLRTPLWWRNATHVDLQHTLELSAWRLVDDLSSIRFDTNNAYIESRQLQVVDPNENINDPSNVGTDGVFPLNIDTICAAFNSRPTYSCSCSRVFDTDVLADCSIGTTTCTPDMVTCYTQSFMTILDARSGVGQADIPTSRMTTCTTFLDSTNTTVTTTVGMLPAPRQVCIELQPTTPGLYHNGFLCGVSVNGVKCRGCTTCTNADTQLPGVGFDCCNVETYATQTCGFVEATTGLTLPFFDPLGTPCATAGAHSIWATSTTSNIITWLLTLATTAWAMGGK